MRKQLIFEKLTIAAIALWPVGGTVAYLISIMVWGMLLVNMPFDSNWFVNVLLAGISIILVVGSIVLKRLTDSVESDVEQDMYSFDFRFYALALNIKYVEGSTLACWGALGAVCNTMIFGTLLMAGVQFLLALKITLGIVAIPYVIYLLSFKKYLNGLEYLQTIQRQRGVYEHQLWKMRNG